MDTILGILVFGGFTTLMVWVFFKMKKQKKNDENDILSMSEEELLTDYKRIVYQLDQLPNILMHGDIHKHSRLTKNLSLIKKELKKRDIK